MLGHPISHTGGRRLAAPTSIANLGGMTDGWGVRASRGKRGRYSYFEGQRPHQGAGPPSRRHPALMGRGSWAGMNRAWHGIGRHGIENLSSVCPTVCTMHYSYVRWMVGPLLMYVHVVSYSCYSRTPLLLSSHPPSPHNSVSSSQLRVRSSHEREAC